MRQRNKLRSKGMVPNQDGCMRYVLTAMTLADKRTTLGCDLVLMDGPSVHSR
jgi:hypothetical protein